MRVSVDVELWRENEDTGIMSRDVVHAVATVRGDDLAVEQPTDYSRRPAKERDVIFMALSVEAERREMER